MGRGIVQLLHLTSNFTPLHSDFQSGGYRIRTCEGVSHQIYSLAPLTTRVTLLDVTNAAMRPSLSSCELQPRGSDSAFQQYKTSALFRSLRPSDHLLLSTGDSTPMI